MVSVFYFTPLPGFFSPFPHGTCSLSVTREYLALRDGPRCFRQDFSCPVVLRIPLEFFGFRLQDFHLLWFNFPVDSSIFWLYSLYWGPTTPVLRLVWAFTFSLATTWVIDSFLSFPSVTKMFQFTELLLVKLFIHFTVHVFSYMCVPTFGNLRIKDYLHLPEAYRCLSRPSSASSAKASAMRPY